jgi:hypothetical protein
MDLRLLTAIGVLALLVSSGSAEPDRAVVPLKPAVVPERGFELPFDLKTEPNIKLRQNDPVVLNPPTVREHRPFFGVGVSQPIEPGK